MQAGQDDNVPLRTLRRLLPMLVAANLQVLRVLCRAGNTPSPAAAPQPLQRCSKTLRTSLSVPGHPRCRARWGSASLSYPLVSHGWNRPIAASDGASGRSLPHRRHAALAPSSYSRQIRCALVASGSTGRKALLGGLRRATGVMSLGDVSRDPTL